MVTIAEVAAQAGVGTGTVSRVLNNSPRVSPTTRERVLDAIQKLDYRPSPLARGLSRGRCQTVGVVIPFFTHASAIERLRGVVAALDESLYDLVLFNVESPQHRDQHFASLRRDRADGLLVISLPPPKPALARLRAAGIPVVLVDTDAPGVASVLTDDVEGGRIATRHLVDLGHERIAFIGDDPGNSLGFTASPRREAGYREVLAEHRIAVRPSLVRYTRHDRDMARALARKLLSSRARPTAVFASSDVQAFGVLQAAHDLEMDVPAHLSVVGFDDIETSSYAGLTTVRQPLYETGYVGGRMLLEVLADERVPRGETRLLPLELVARSTTAAPPPRKVTSGPAATYAGTGR